MKTEMRFWTLFIMAALLCHMGITVQAHDVLDLSRKGSIKVIMKYEDSAVSGGTLTLYRVGEVEEKNGDVSFILTGGFADSGVLLDNIESADLALDLGRYAADNEINGETKSVASDGTVIFSNLIPGLYLMVQNTAPNGYYELAPFLVSVPMYDQKKDEYLYQVDASPKVELGAKKTEEPEVPTEPEMSTEPEVPTESEYPYEPEKTIEPKVPEKPEEIFEPAVSVSPNAPVESSAQGDPTLPQLGQLNWPVPVLVALGLTLFAAGWTMRYGKKKNDYEE